MSVSHTPPFEGVPTSMQLPDVSAIRAGNFSIAITRDPSLVKQAQELRYRVFCLEFGATPSDASLALDSDRYDAVCDHLIVFDHSENVDAPKVIGNYRLLRSEPMKQVGKFYTESEFDISPLYKAERTLLELGRSCVDPEHRTGRVMQMLWKGIGAYVEHFNITLMFGCASFHGSDPMEHIQGLSYLYHFHAAPENLRPTPLKEYDAGIAYLPKDSIDQKAAFFNLPPLIKGYLRLGGMVGAAAALDKTYNTTDICIMVDRLAVSDRYVNKFSPQGAE